LTIATGLKRKCDGAPPVLIRWNDCFDDEQRSSGPGATMASVDVTTQPGRPQP
jgi:hypothetical protein